jgi:hypothetical protein
VLLRQTPQPLRPHVSSSSYTLLHLAAANGHSTVVRILLLHGAHTDQADKHGVTPEMLARENREEPEGTAEVLKAWMANEDQDLREREGDGGSESGSGTERKSSSTGVLDYSETTVRKHLHVDHALNSLKACCLAPAPEPASPLGECTFYAPSASRPNTTAND